MLNTFPTLIVRYAGLLEEIGEQALPRRITVDKETRRLRYPPYYSPVHLCGEPVQPLLDSYHGMERITLEEAVDAWNRLGLAIADGQPPTAVRNIAEEVFPTHGFPLDNLAIATQFLSLCIRCEVGAETGDREKEFGLVSGLTRIGMTQRVLYFSKPQTLKDKRGRAYTSEAVGVRGLAGFDFKAAVQMQRNPITIRPALAGARAMLIQAAPDQRAGIDIVLSVVAASGYRLDVDAPTDEPSVYERLVTANYNIEEVSNAPPLYDEWEPLRRLVRTVSYNPTNDLFTALQDIPYREFVKLFGIPQVSGVVQPYPDALRQRHLQALDQLSGKVSKDADPAVENTLELQKLISRLV